MTSGNLNTFSPKSPHQVFNVNMMGIQPKSHITVIGAGAFGCWSAFYLHRAGFKVTLIDSWGPGNSRSSSGDETRVIRSTYGANERYFNSNVRALELWKQHQKEFNKQLFFNTGVLWMCYEENTPMVDDSIPFAEKNNMPYEYLSRDNLKKRYPLLNTKDLHHGWFDPFGGYLKARESCQAVVDHFIKEGGTYLQQYVKPGEPTSGRLDTIELSDGSTLTADAFLFACGSWLGSIFPELKSTITCTRQEVYYFGVPSESSLSYENFPVWIDVDGKDFYYGIPGNNHRGFKIGVDKRGEKFDPSTGDHLPNPQVLQEARGFLSNRFPELKNAPLIENRVCPYENSPDGNFIFEKHPGADNVIFLGGGSGHGFKHGPALGEAVSLALQGKPNWFSV